MDDHTFTQIRLNFLNAYFISQISLWIRANSQQAFLEKTNFTEKHLSQMIDLNFNYTLKDIANIAITLDMGVTLGFTPLPDKK